MDVAVATSVEGCVLRRLLLLSSVYPSITTSNVNTENMMAVTTSVAATVTLDG